MKLVYIYGPPGVGKLTVARDLSAITGYGVFHNHLSIDTVLPVFGYSDEQFWPLVNNIRLYVIEEAARENRDIIFTCVYEPPDLELTQARFAAVERHSGTVCPVRLTCAEAELYGRVESEQRRSLGKLASAKTLRESLATRHLMATIPGRTSLIIDNTDLPPHEVAERIVDQFELGTR
jgi:AAA domain